ncbi:MULTISPECIES: hypothetical protein [unclassified Bradyrhizobium]|uniref:hypothetical protein n=1 Tax=unclassified Bradyrhizobium TaxID=2631580 RepID=UPI0028EC60CA|nr:MULTISPECIES: hypothetical protein [unclassified Bradyrhizobium]
MSNFARRHAQLLPGLFCCVIFPLATATAERVVRYVSWIEGWLDHLLPERVSAEKRSRRSAVAPRRSAELSSEDLFYIAMLGPHV